MRTATRGATPQIINKDTGLNGTADAAFKTLEIDPRIVVADPERALADTLTAINKLPAPEETKPAAPAEAPPRTPLEIPTRAPEEAPQDAPQPLPEVEALSRASIPRSAPIPIPVEVAAELAEFEGAYAANADTRDSPEKMARLLDSLGFNTLVQWITANPASWKTAQIVGFILDSDAEGDQANV